MELKTPHHLIRNTNQGVTRSIYDSYVTSLAINKDLNVTQLI